MKKITCEELKTMAAEAKESIFAQAAQAGREPAIYLHWSAGKYGSFFEDYHINIDHDGTIYVSVPDLGERLAHTYRRNSGAIGVSLACAYNATTNDFGEAPPTKYQIESMARVIAVLCKEMDIPCDPDHVMTHAEAAELDAYGPSTTCERWDLWFFPGVEKGEGGNVLRGKAVYYMEKGLEA